MGIVSSHDRWILLDRPMDPRKQCTVDAYSLSWSISSVKMLCFLWKSYPVLQKTLDGLC